MIYSRRKILIVDDDQENIRIISSILREEGYEVGHATTSENALKILKADPENFDLLLMDVNMHGMNGFAELNRIRQVPALQELPVILITPNAELEKIAEEMEGVDHNYLTKPFNVRELIAKVGTQIELKENRDQLHKINLILEEKVRERTKELEQANQKLEKANFELSLLDQAKVDFLEIISHEINTPLNGILGFAWLLKDQLQTTEYFDLIECLSESAQRLNDFAQSSLLIARIRTSPQKYKKSSMDIRFLIRELIEKMSNVKPEVKLSLIDQLPGNYTTISGNGELARVCLTNLLKNALQFSPKGGVISILLSMDKDFVTVEISDNGQGFSAISLKTQFKPFSPGEKYTGNNKGLGLALSKMVMDFHDGKISLSNKKESGARVTLQFPVQQSNPVN